jgi:Flp pilus assembly pilin Flp
MHSSSNPPSATSRRLLRPIARFLRDERGDSIQWVMGLAIAAVIIAALYMFAGDALTTLDGWITNNTEELSVEQ